MHRAIRAAVVTAVGVATLGIAPAQEPPRMTFFLISEGRGTGADLGGIEGADRLCQALAGAAGADDLTWRAYLSRQADDDDPAIHARDRIGEGPWHNAEGVLIARDVEHLHSDDSNIDKQTALTEYGEVVNGRGDSPNEHDILTGSRPDGTAYPPDVEATCFNWHSRTGGSARVGHHDRTGGGEFPTSWNSAHSSRGCSQRNLIASGGAGKFYCFAVDAGDAGESR